MPDGLLQWYDAREGVGRIVRQGRRYPVRAADMDAVDGAAEPAVAHA